MHFVIYTIIAEIIVIDTLTFEFMHLDTREGLLSRCQPRFWHLVASN